MVFVYQHFILRIHENMCVQLTKYGMSILFVVSGRAHMRLFATVYNFSVYHSLCF